MAVKTLYRNPAYLAWIRKQPCCITGQEPFGMGNPIEACHYRLGAGAGISQKPSDYRALPLVSDKHREQHKIGEITFWEKYGKDPLTLIFCHLAAYKRDIPIEVMLDRYSKLESLVDNKFISINEELLHARYLESLSNG